MNTSNKKWNKVKLSTSIKIRVLHQHFGMAVCLIAKKYKNIPRRTVQHHAKLPLLSEDKDDMRQHNIGRPRLLTERDERRIRTTVEFLRKFENPNFTSKRVHAISGLTCSNRTVRRVLNKAGYHFLHSRQKGLLTKHDLILRRKFAKTAKTFGDNLWTAKVSMYYDGVTFYHKLHPYDDVIAPQSLVWRKRGEGLLMSAKGKKEGNNGPGAKFFVGISYNKGVIMCDQWDSTVKFNGINYNTFVKERWRPALEKCTNPRNKLVLQDGCPVQNSKQAKLAYNDVGCKILGIPPRSPDINPIENIFHLVRLQLAAEVDARNIKTESFEEFSARVKATIEGVSIQVIDKTIESMPKRIEMVKTLKGLRTKY